jgi:hypothetical protein
MSNYYITKLEFNQKYENETNKIFIITVHL